MDIDTTIEEIKILLGYPTVNIEIGDDSIETLVGVAFKKIQPYLCDTQLMTIKNSPATPLSVIDVVNVYETSLTDAYSTRSSSETIDLFSYQVVSSSGQFSSSNYSRSLYSAEMETVESKTFRYLNGTLYLSGYQGKYVTVEAYLEPTLDTVVDERAKVWIFDYSVALCKESLGRVRSKYKSSSTPLELDGEALLQEAQQEKERLHQELSELSYGEFLVLR